MVEKYTAPDETAILPRIITSDMFLAAYLLTQACTLDKVVLNERRRVAFVFEGEAVKQFKQEYRENRVYVELRSFHENLNFIRRLVDEKLNERNASCPLPYPRALSQA